MTAAQFWNAGHVITFFVPFDDNAELTPFHFLHEVNVPENDRVRKVVQRPKLSHGPVLAILVKMQRMNTTVLECGSLLPLWLQRETRPPSCPP